MGLSISDLVTLLGWFKEDPHVRAGGGVPERVKFFRETLFPMMRESCIKYGEPVPDYLEPSASLVKAFDGIADREAVQRQGDDAPELDDEDKEILDRLDAKDAADPRWNPRAARSRAEHGNGDAIVATSDPIRDDVGKALDEAWAEEGRRSRAAR